MQTFISQYCDDPTARVFCLCDMLITPEAQRTSRELDLTYPRCAECLSMMDVKKIANFEVPLDQEWRRPEQVDKSEIEECAAKGMTIAQAAGALRIKPQTLHCYVTSTTRRPAYRAAWQKGLERRNKKAELSLDQKLAKIEELAFSGATAVKAARSLGMQVTTFLTYVNSTRYPVYRAAWRRGKDRSREVQQKLPFAA